MLKNISGPKDFGPFPKQFLNPSLPRRNPQLHSEWTRHVMMQVTSSTLSQQLTWRYQAQCYHVLKQVKETAYRQLVRSDCTRARLCILGFGIPEIIADSDIGSVDGKLETCRYICRQYNMFAGGSAFAPKHWYYKKHLIATTAELVRELVQNNLQKVQKVLEQSNSPSTCTYLTELTKSNHTPIIRNAYTILLVYSVRYLQFWLDVELVTGCSLLIISVYRTQEYTTGNIQII